MIHITSVLATKKPLIRNIYADQHFEAFLVTAVASIIGIRFFLSLTGYPKLGGGGLHIAHVLVGGFFMMVAIADPPSHSWTGTQPVLQQF